MTLRPGASWGAPGLLPSDGVIVESDAEARALVEEARRSGQAIPPVGLLGGDLCRTLGGTGDKARLASSSATTFTVDLGTAVLDGAQHWFVAHLVARRRGLLGLGGLPFGGRRGRVVAVMNAEWIGSWDVAPRAHPGDGRLDLLDAHLSLSDRFAARKRLPTGTHVPHPSIRERRVSSWEADLDPELDIWLDGILVGRVAHLAVRVEHEALQVVV